ncbi:MAG: hypothetical protein IPN47_10570 [Gemmatimonadetes bacterium]|nr:hypothetical protein [Gemmatimonadota bacterium]
MRSPNPTIFFEHRSLLMTSDGSAVIPATTSLVPLGSARRLRTGGDVTAVNWGAIAHRCVDALAMTDASVN